MNLPGLFKSALQDFFCSLCRVRFARGSFIKGSICLCGSGNSKIFICTLEFRDGYIKEYLLCFETRNSRLFHLQLQRIYSTTKTARNNRQFTETNQALLKAQKFIESRYWKQPSRCDLFIRSRPGSAPQRAKPSSSRIFSHSPRQRRRRRAPTD